MVVGFLFDTRRNHVALIRKARPAWQAGCLNGVGGKIEDLENADAAMVREFREETGVEIHNWRMFATLVIPGCRVYCYVAFGGFQAFRTDTDEPVNWYDLDELETEKTIPNLRWLIPMALDRDEVVSGICYPSTWQPGENS